MKARKRRETVKSASVVKMFREFVICHSRYFIHVSSILMYQKTARTVFLLYLDDVMNAI